MDRQPGVLIPDADLGRRLRRAGWVGAACALLAMAVVLASPLAGLLAKAVVDPFFHSTSAGAAVALLGLAALSGLALTRAPGAVSAWQVRAAAALLLAGIVLGNAANLAMHLRLLAAHGLPWSTAVYHWAGETNTYSYVLHAHTGKSALHALLAGWSAPLTQSFDIGAGLAAQVPVGWAALCAVSLVGAVVAYAWLLPVVVARWPGWPVPLLFAFCALNGLKTIADGGPLTYRFAPVLAVLLWLLPATLRLGVGIRRAGRVVACGVLLLSGGVSAALAGPQVDEMLHGLAATLAVLGALAAWAWRPARPLGRWLRGTAVGVCTAGVLASLAASLIATPLALLTPLPDGMRATVCRREAPGCVQFDVAGQRAFEVYRQAGDDPLKPRQTMLSTGPAAGRSRLLFAVHPVSTRPPEALRYRAVSVLLQGPLPGGVGVLVEAVATRLPTVFDAAPSAFSSANYYVFLHLTAAELRAQGLSTFLLAPLRSHADAQALGLR